MMMKIEHLYEEAIGLLKLLIQTSSFSGEEHETGDKIENWLSNQGIATQRSNNNVWAINKFFDEQKPTILLNSHHDTIKPNKNYTNDPFDPIVKDGKLFGLGSNDAGGCLVSLIALFTHYYNDENLSYNLIIAATGEEENSGDNGLRSLLPLLPNIDFALVGEPTEMNLAISEKGLLVIDGYASGVSGHAAHDNTVNAIYEATKDINWIKDYQFPIASQTLGKVKMSVTQINAGDQHNVIPAACHFVVDVRINDAYTNREVFEMIDQNTSSKMVARSFKHNSSSISVDHILVQSGAKLGRETYGSPTMSDQTALTCPSLKMGPGVSSRSHTADEYIKLEEIKEGIDLYIKLFESILLK
jgi:acetylornithine deacetylase